VPEELVIRIKSKYERPDRMIALQGVTYDPLNKTVQKEGEIITLGEVQANLFHTLVMRSNTVVDSYTLMDFLEQPNANALRVNLAKLKSKLGIEIKNIRGQGYMIENL